MIKLTKEQLLDGARSLAVEYTGDGNRLRLTPPTNDGGGWRYTTIGTDASGKEYEACYGTLNDSQVVIRALILAALT